MGHWNDSDANSAELNPLLAAKTKDLNVRNIHRRKLAALTQLRQAEPDGSTNWSSNRALNAGRNRLGCPFASWINSL